MLNQDIEKYERESVLMTFFYFDQQVFVKNRKYTNIPLDLFEQIPEAGIKHNHEHSSEDGYGYKEFSFNVNEQSNGNDIGKMAVVCFDFFHCTGCNG